jgi:oxysterol-binding protein 1
MTFSDSRLWVDNHGDMEIIGQNAAQGYKCHLKYLPYSYFTRDSQRRIKGVVMDTQKQVATFDVLSSLP